MDSVKKKTVVVFPVKNFIQSMVLSSIKRDQFLQETPQRLKKKLVMISKVHLFTQERSLLTYREEATGAGRSKRSFQRI